MTRFAALLRRELWEHRSLLAVPLVLAALVLCGSLYGIVRGTSLLGEVAHSDHVASALSHPHAGEAVPAIYMGLAAVFGIVLTVVLILYLSDCLYADRRDRSILFWKSLPVSDAATVLSKLTTGLIVAPAVTLAIAFVTTLGVLAMATAALWIGGVAGSSALWQFGPFVRAIAGVPFVALLLALWYAPVAAWFVLASAFAPRAPLMWATLPPVALIVLEQVTFQTHRVPEFLGERLGGVFPRLFRTEEYRGIGVHDGDVVINAPALGDVLGYLSSLDLWGGLAAAAAFTAAAIALRRYRDET
jgi:ABC-2 type transport system permease protein